MKLMHVITGVLVALMLLVAVPVAAATGSGVEPILMTLTVGDANFEVGQVECCGGPDFAYKWNEDPDDLEMGEEGDIPPPLNYPAEGAPNGEIIIGDGNTITITNSDGYYFDWESEWPVSCVLVKAGKDYYNVFCYGPAGSYGDTGLYAPINPANNQMFQISHLSFGYNESDMCWQEETAWAQGTKYVNAKKGDGSNWAMYIEYTEKGVYDLIADGGVNGAKLNVGTATFGEPYDNTYTYTVIEGKGKNKQEVTHTVTESWVTITIQLNGGAIFYYDEADPYADDNIKVQDYPLTPNLKTPPNPGSFEWKKAIGVHTSTATLDVPVNNFYGIHLDVAVPVPCE